MIVTTSYNETEELIQQARLLASELGGSFVPRRDRSVRHLLAEEGEPLLIVETGGLKFYKEGMKDPFFFHPNMAKVRIKRLLQGDNDRMIEACALKKGDQLLDATLGLASDAITASFVTGEGGRVVGVEVEPTLALIVSWGLKHYTDALSPMVEAMRRIETVNGNAFDYLRNSKDQSFDVVYFDPMFRTSVLESSAMSFWRNHAATMPLTPDMIEEACRVARRRVVLKERKYSGEFERLGFQTILDSPSSFAFGVIEIKEGG